MFCYPKAASTPRLNRILMIPNKKFSTINLSAPFSMFDASTQDIVITVGPLFMNIAASIHSHVKIGGAANPAVNLALINSWNQKSEFTRASFLGNHNFVLESSVLLNEDVSCAMKLIEEGLTQFLDSWDLFKDRLALIESAGPIVLWSE